MVWRETRRMDEENSVGRLRADFPVEINQGRVEEEKSELKRRWRQRRNVSHPSLRVRFYLTVRVQQNASPLG
jgi:hypothetical protein